jgi:hypothetical protein
MLGDRQSVRENFRNAIRHASLAGEIMRAAQIKRNFSVALADLGMRDLGGEYILSARTDFQLHGVQGADQEITVSNQYFEEFAVQGSRRCRDGA